MVVWFADASRSGSKRFMIDLERGDGAVRMVCGWPADC